MDTETAAVVENAPLPPEGYITFNEVARELRCSPDTLRRHFIQGKLDEIEWVDFFGNNKLCATRESFDEFKRLRLQETKKVYTQSLAKSRVQAKTGVIRQA